MSYSISQIKEMAELFEVTPEWAIGHRIDYFKSITEYYREHQDKMAKFISGANVETREFILSSIKDSQKHIKGFEGKVKALTITQSNKPGFITDEMRSEAKEYPIDNLIEVLRGMALCPFHDDHHPSMSIHNNRFHCFACGAKGDSIEFIRRRDGLSFQDAVKTLTGNRK